MSRLGLAFSAAILAFSGCAKDPERDSGGGGTGGGLGGTGGSGPMYVPPALKLSHPSPIISRAAPVFASPATGPAVVIGVYHGGGWNAGSPTTAAPAGSRSSWPPDRRASSSAGTTTGPTTTRTRRHHGLRLSRRLPLRGVVGSTDGVNGAWTMAGTPVTGNHVRTRAQALDFAGKLAQDGDHRRARRGEQRRSDRRDRRARHLGERQRAPDEPGSSWATASPRSLRSPGSNHQASLALIDTATAMRTSRR